MIARSIMKSRPAGYWTDERFLIEIRKLKDSGISLKESYVRKINGSLTHLAAKRYGGWYNAVKEAGIDPTPYMVQKPKGYWTKERIWNEIGQRRKEGRSLEYSIVVRESPALVAAAEDKYEGWYKAIEAAGFSRSEFGKNEKWTKEKIISRIKELYDSGEDLSAGYSYYAHSRLMNATVRNFGSWEKAIEAAGIDYDSIRKQH